MKKNLRRVTITVTAQTLYHLKDLAAVHGYSETGRVVDKLVREHQMAAKIRTTPNGREEMHHVRN